MSQTEAICSGCEKKSDNVKCSDIKLNKYGECLNYYPENDEDPSYYAEDYIPDAERRERG